MADKYDTHFEFFPEVGPAYMVPLRVAVEKNGSSRLTLGHHGGTGTYQGKEFDFTLGYSGTLEVRFKNGPTFEINVRDMIPVAAKAWDEGHLPEGALRG